MLRVAVIGGAGFIGTPLLRRLESNGAEPICVSRTSRGGDYRHIAADRTNPEDLAAKLAAIEATVVIDLLGMTLPPTAAVIDAVGNRVERYIFISSADVYRNYGGMIKRENPAPINTPLVETSPLRASRFPYRVAEPRPREHEDAWLDGYDKIPIEMFVRENVSNATILRLPMVYGPGDKQKRFSDYVEPMKTGRRTIEIADGWARFRTTYGYVDNIADAIAVAAIDETGRGETFNLGEPDAVDHREWAARFAKAAGWRGEIKPVEDVRSPNASLLAGLDLSYPLVLDTSKFRRAFGWAEPISQDECISRTLASQE